MLHRPINHKMALIPSSETLISLFNIDTSLIKINKDVILSEILNNNYDTTSPNSRYSTYSSYSTLKSLMS